MSSPIIKLSSNASFKFNISIGKLVISTILSTNTAILRFNSNKESDSFLRKFYNGGGELLKGMFKYDKINKPRMFGPKENSEYLELVKEKLQNFKADKLNKKLKKLKMK